MFDLDPEIIKKIQKLHAMSTSTHLGEADNASKMRDRLLEKYEITLDDLDSFQTKDTKLTEDVMEMTGRKKMTILFDVVLGILKKHFFVEVVYHNDTHLRISLIGNKSDVEIAKYIFTYLCRKFEAEWNRYKKLYPGAHRNSFLFGMHDGLDKKLTTQTKNDVQEFGLIVVDQKEKRQTFVKSLYRTRSVSSKARLNQRDDYDAGVVHGGRIDIRAGVEGKEQQALPGL